VRSIHSGSQYLFLPPDIVSYLTFSQTNINAETNMNLNPITKNISNKIAGAAFLAVCLLAFSVAGRCEAAGYKAVLGGITISYSLPGASAYYYPDDGTLTVEVTQDGGSLSISCGSTANANWGNLVDVYILANNTVLKSISIKGFSSKDAAPCWPCVCGDVYYVSKFAMSYGCIGGTAYYGRDFGLGEASKYVTSAISLKNSYATAQLLGYPNSSSAAAVSQKSSSLLPGAEKARTAE
jgi:hypothetical protein